MDVIMNWLYRESKGELYSLAGPHALIALVLLIATTSTLTGCISTAQRKAGADKDVYRILEAKSPAVPGMVDDVDIEAAEQWVLDGFPTNETRPQRRRKLIRTLTPPVVVSRPA